MRYWLGNLKYNQNLAPHQVVAAVRLMDQLTLWSDSEQSPSYQRPQELVFTPKPAQSEQSNSATLPQVEKQTGKQFLPREYFQTKLGHAHAVRFCAETEKENEE